MTPARRRFLGGFGLVGIVLVALGIALLQPGSVRSSHRMFGWLALEARLRLALEPDASRHLHSEIAQGPVALATIVQRLQPAFPGQKVAVVHGAASEIASHLLHHQGVEVGDLQGGKFVAWKLRPWAAAGKIDTELRALDEPLEDDTRYVFRRK